LRSKEYLMAVRRDVEALHGRRKRRANGHA
jgi:hypothetical protein